MTRVTVQSRTRRLERSPRLGASAASRRAARAWADSARAYVNPPAARAAAGSRSGRIGRLQRRAPSGLAAQRDVARTRSVLAVPVVEPLEPGRSRRGRGTRSCSSAGSSRYRPARRSRRPDVEPPAPARNVCATPVPAGRDTTCPALTGSRRRRAPAFRRRRGPRRSPPRSSGSAAGSASLPGATSKCCSPASTEPAARPMSRRSCATRARSIVLRLDRVDVARPSAGRSPARSGSSGGPSSASRIN